jgi:hypothetical protein
MPVSGSDFGFTTMAQGRDKLSAVLADKRMLVAVDNVAECGPLDALTGLASCCTVLFTTRVPGLAATFGASPIPVDELTQGQALDLLGSWTGQAPSPVAGRLLGRVAVGAIHAAELTFGSWPSNANSGTCQ